MKKMIKFCASTSQGVVQSFIHRQNTDKSIVGYTLQGDRVVFDRVTGVGRGSFNQFKLSPYVKDELLKLKQVTKWTPEEIEWSPVEVVLIYDHTFKLNLVDKGEMSAEEFFA